MIQYCQRFLRISISQLNVFPIIKLVLFYKVIWNHIRKTYQSRGVFYLNAKGMAFKFVSCHLSCSEARRGKKKINKHQSFISVQFSSYGEQRIPYSKCPKQPNFRQLDRAFNQVSPNRDSNQVSHDEFHSQSRTDYRAGRIAAHYWLEINFQLEGLWGTVHNRAGGGPGEFNSVTNQTKWDPLSLKRGQSYHLTFLPYLSRKYSALEKKKKLKLRKKSFI